MVAKKTERKEDLNPRLDEIEAKVRQMMEPGEPQEMPKESAKPASAQKIRIIPLSPDDNDAPSAPELPGSKPVPVAGDAALKVIKKNRPIIALNSSNKTDDEEPSDLKQQLDDKIAVLADNKAKAAEPEVVPAKSTKKSKIQEVIDDKQTDKAVDEILHEEGDTLLEVDDNLRETGAPAKLTKVKTHPFKNLLKNRLVRWFFILLIIGTLIAGAIWPLGRYSALNALGVKASSSLAVIDTNSQQPLKDADVSLGSFTGKTDDKGMIKASNLKLGKTNLTISKLAYAPITKTITIGWGSNPLGNFNLTPTGAQYDITALDFLSGKSIMGASASNKDYNAKADTKGIIKLTIDTTNAKTLDVTISAPGYKDSVLKVDLNDHKPRQIKLVPARKHLYVSKKSGKYDIYSSFANGSNQELVLAATGNEQSDISLLPHASDNVSALVASRSNQTDTSGHLLSNLLIIDESNKQTSVVTTAAKIQLVGFNNDYLVYVKTLQNSADNDPNKNQLYSYDYKTGDSKRLATSNYFNDVVLVSDKVYFAPSSAYSGGTPANFYSINPDGSGQKSLLGSEALNILRLSYDHLTISSQQSWYDYAVGSDQPSKLSNAPANQNSRIYIDNSDSSLSAWVDQRDGKGVLLIYNAKTKADTILTTKNGLNTVIGWLNDSVVVYRVVSSDETADYAISTNGGDPFKITDVTNSQVLQPWHL